VFDGNGKWETQWNNLHRPNGMHDARFIARFAIFGGRRAAGRDHRDWPNIGPRVSIHTLQARYWLGSVTAACGDIAGTVHSPHGIAVDSQGNIYVGELSGRSWGRFSKDPAPAKRRVIHKNWSRSRPERRSLSATVRCWQQSAYAPSPP